jgi:hypothetical protein
LVEGEKRGCESKSAFEEKEDEDEENVQSYSQSSPSYRDQVLPFRFQHSFHLESSSSDSSGSSGDESGESI